MTRQKTLPGGILDTPPPLPDCRSSKSALWAYAQKVHSGWTRTCALMGEQRVTLAHKTHEASAMAMQLQSIKDELQKIKVERRSDLAVLRT